MFNANYAQDDWSRLHLQIHPTASRIHSVICLVSILGRLFFPSIGESARAGVWAPEHFRLLIYSLLLIFSSSVARTSAYNSSSSVRNFLTVDGRLSLSLTGSWSVIARHPSNWVRESK